MFLSPSQQIESQSTCTVFLGGSFLGGRRGRGKPHGGGVCACVCVIRIKFGSSSGVITKV